jgi:excisionase family DNA binding protein
VTTRETYLTAGDVARVLHVSVSTVGRWPREGRLPFLRTLGGHRRCPEPLVAELARSSHHSGTRA